MYLSKDEGLRKSEDWETREIRPDLLQYAALDVYASRIVFEKATEIAPLATVDSNTPLGTRIILLLQEGGAPAAYGKIAETQPVSLGHVRVKVPTKSRLVVDIDHLLVPSASAILHLLPGEKRGKAKAGTLTLGQLRDMSASPIFQVVASVSHLKLDHNTDRNNFSSVRNLQFFMPVVWFPYSSSHFQMPVDNRVIPGPSDSESLTNPSCFGGTREASTYAAQDSQLRDELRVDTSEVESDMSSDEDDSNMLKMFEAFSAANSKQKGLYLDFLFYFSHY
jgi:hypothetical protein